MAGLGEAQVGLNCPGREGEEIQAGKAFPETLHWEKQQDFQLEWGNCEREGWEEGLREGRG